MAMRARPTGGSNPAGRQRVVVRPVYEDIKPMSEWIQDQESDILLIHLPGFTKETLKVSTESGNIIRVRGERLVAGNKWNRFQEDYQVSDSSNLRGTRARFEGGILTITVPKKNVVVGPKDHEHKPSGNDQKQPSPQKNQEYNPPRITQNDQKDETKAVGEVVPPLTSDVRNRKAAEEAPLRPHVNPPKTTHMQPLSPAAHGEKSQDHDTPPITQKMLNEVKPRTNEKFPEAPTTKTRKDQDDERRESNEEKGKVIADNSKLEKKMVGFVEEEKKGEYVEQKRRETREASSSRTDHFGLENLKQSVKKLTEKDEERQLLVNVGVAVLVIVALGTYVCNTIRE